MANSLGTLSSDLILQESLDNPFKDIPWLKDISTDFSAKPILFGQTVLTRIQGVSSVQPFGSAPTAVDDLDVPVTLNGDNQVFENFTSEQLNSTNRNLIQERAEPISNAIGTYLAGQVAALVTPANYPNEAVVDANPATYNSLVLLRKVMKKRGIPGPYFMIPNSDIYAQFLEDLRLIANYISAGNSEAVSGGVLGAKAGFRNIQEYPDLPGANNLLGVALSRGALVLVVRPPENPEKVFGGGVTFPGGRISYVTNVRTGFTIAAAEFINQADWSANVQMRFFSGQAVGNPIFLERLVSAATGAAGTVVDS